LQGVSYTAATEPNRVIMPDDVADEDYVYLLKDLYTVAGLADERGWPVERYDYDAYGQVQMSRCAILPYAADFDGDGDVDDDDLAILKQCYKGSGNEPNSYGGLGWIADLDGDGDVDGSDYVQFVYAYNGSGNPPRGAATPSVSLGSMVTSRVGNPYFFTGRRLDVLDISDNGTPHRFTDDVAGLAIHDFRARTMDPVLGRFLQHDPLHYANGANLYEYVNSDPLADTDPSGMAPKDKRFGYEDEFWKWYHRRYKDRLDPDADAEDARERYKEWEALGKPSPDNKRKRGERDQSDEGWGEYARSTAKRVLAGAGAVGVGYGIYRVLRMLPSLAPPLWWTVPANLACP